MCYSFRQRCFPATLFIILLFFLWASSATAADSAESQPSTVSAETDIHGLLSGLSDEQVRRLLIEELQKDTVSGEVTVEPEGPGAFLDDLLSDLEGASVSTDGQAKALFKNLPLVLPDLYKVFVTL